MCLHVWYSTEDDFSNAQLIFSMTKMPANNMQDGKIQPVVKLQPNQSLRLRFYPWYNGTATGKTLCLSDIKFHGYASSAAPSGVKDIEESTVATTYFTLQGIAVENPKAGNVYIKCERRSDGTTATSKIRM